MSNNAELLKKALRERIVIIDGAMGTTIRTYSLGEADVRGERFKDAKKDLKNWTAVPNAQDHFNGDPNTDVSWDVYFSDNPDAPQMFYRVIEN